MDVSAGQKSASSAPAARDHRLPGAERAGDPLRLLREGLQVGGNWRYENDNGMSSAYRSLHINTSRRVMAFKTPADAGPLPGLPGPLPDGRLLRRIRRPLRPAREDPFPHRGPQRRAGRRRVGGDVAGRRRERASESLPRRAGRQRPPLGPALARTGLPGRRGVRGRADPRPPLPRARGAARQAGAGAGDRQLGHRHRGRVLADRREDLPGDAPRRLRHAQVHERQADRRGGLEAADA